VNDFVVGKPTDSYYYRSDRRRREGCREGERVREDERRGKTEREGVRDREREKHQTERQTDK